MNKGELVDAIAGKVDLSKTAIREVVDNIIELVGKTAKKEPVTLLGLGTFKMVKRKARNGVNPATGAKIKIAGYKTIKFTPSAGLKKF